MTFLPRILAVVTLVAALATAIVVAVAAFAKGDPADGTLQRYAAAWSRGDDRAAARLTDRPQEALAQLTASRRGLDGARVKATVGSVREDGDGRASAAVAVAWEIPRIGRWSYRVRLRARHGENGWSVAWRPTAVHAALSGTSRLGTVRRAPARGRIEARDGRAIVTERPVVHVAVETRRVRDAGETAQRLAALVDVEATPLERSIRRAGRGRFVPVITLRERAFAAIEDELTGVPGVSLAPDTAPLAPSKGFAGALLGTVAPATAEQLERAGGRLAEGDEIGQWGLQAAFERQLAGTPSAGVVVRDSEDGTVLKTLKRRRGQRPAALRTTLDLDVQAAAEQALGDSDRNAALVALKPSSGDILAVANRPLDSSLNRALNGLYPPGSTFKVVSTAALLRDGLSVGETVACPRNALVDGRSFRNFEGSAQGAVSFAVDFAQSCNTAFIALAPRLQEPALTRTARDYGIGPRIKLPVPAADGKVPAASDSVARAAMMIGQDRIVASPLVMAGVAATVADGRSHAPRLLADDPRRAGPRLPAGEAETLRTLMRSVVTGGTGQALSGLPGAVSGKSGTAEYGGGDPPPTHAWFIAFRGDLAISVLVEGGRSGGSVAAPIAARFFEALG